MYVNLLNLRCIRNTAQVVIIYSPLCAESKNADTMAAILFNEVSDDAKRAKEANQEGTNSMQMSGAWRRIPGCIIIIGPIYYVLRAAVRLQVHTSVSSYVSHSIHRRRFPDDAFNCEGTMRCTRETYHLMYPIASGSILPRHSTERLVALAVYSCFV